MAETLTEKQADELLREVFTGLAGNVDQLPKQLQWLRDLNSPQKLADKYPAARQQLLDLGRPAKEVDALPKSQVVLLYYINEYERVGDDILKALALPPWQAWPLIEDATQPLRAAGDTGCLAGAGTCGKTAATASASTAAFIFEASSAVGHA